MQSNVCDACDLDSVVFEERGRLILSMYILGKT